MIGIMYVYIRYFFLRRCAVLALTLIFFVRIYLCGRDGWPGPDTASLRRFYPNFICNCLDIFSWRGKQVN